MAIQSKHPPEQFGPEAVHYRHNDDQRRYAKADAQQQKNGDHRDEAFLPPRAEIAHRDHAFESAEDHACQAFMDLEFVAAGPEASGGRSNDLVPVIRRSASRKPRRVTALRAHRWHGASTPPRRSS